MALTHYRDYTGSLANQPVRGMFGASLGIDWIQGLIARGYGGHVEVGTLGTFVAGDGTVLDLDRPVFGISCAAGYTLVPFNVKMVVRPGIQTTDSHVTDALLAVDRSAAWAGDGTVVTETVYNLKSGTGVTGISAFSAATADITDPVLTMCLDRASYLTDVQGTATTVNLMQLRIDYEPLRPPFLNGPCAMYGYWGGSIQAVGCASINFVAFPTSLLTEIVG